MEIIREQSIKEEKNLTNLVKDILKSAMNSSEFEYSDTVSFGEVIQKLMKIENMKLKPHLITWHINEWEYVGDLIYSGLEVLGYEFVGNMDLSDDEYKFETNDIFYEKLFRFKNKNCDYTQHLKFEIE